MTVAELIAELERVAGESPQGQASPVYITTGGGLIDRAATVIVTFETEDGAYIVVDTISD